MNISMHIQYWLFLETNFEHVSDVTTAMDIYWIQVNVWNFDGVLTSKSGIQWHSIFFFEFLQQEGYQVVAAYEWGTPMTFVKLLMDQKLPGAKS